MWGSKSDKAKKEYPHYGWKPGMEPAYVKRDDGLLYVEDCNRDYKIATEEDFLKFRDFADDVSDQWTLKSSKQDIFAWDRPTKDKEKSPVNIFKFFSEFKDVKPEVLYDVLHDADYRATWDPNMIEGFNLIHLDANNDVGYYHVRFPPGLSNRDFCNQRSWRNVDNKEFIIMNHSVPHERCPPTKAVRALSIIGGYLIRPHGNGCSMTFVTQSDVKGWIPTVVINTLLTSQGPSIVDKLYKASLGYPEWKSKNNPDVKHWRTEPQPWSKPQPQRMLQWFALRKELSLDTILGAEEAAIVIKAAEDRDKEATAKPQETEKPADEKQDAEQKSPADPPAAEEQK